MAPGGVGVHAARVRFGAMGAGGAMDPTIPLEPVRAFAGPPHVDEAAELLAAAPVHAIASASRARPTCSGADGEATWSPASSSGRAASRSSPPARPRSPAFGRSASTASGWSAALVRRRADRPGGAYFRGRASTWSAPRRGLPSDQRERDPAGPVDWVAEHVPEPQRPSSSAATASGPSARSRRWRRRSACRCSRPTRPCSGGPWGRRGHRARRRLRAAVRPRPEARLTPRAGPAARTPPSPRPTATPSARPGGSAWPASGAA